MGIWMRMQFFLGSYGSKCFGGKICGKGDLLASVEAGDTGGKNGFVVGKNGICKASLKDLCVSCVAEALCKYVEVKEREAVVGLSKWCMPS